MIQGEMQTQFEDDCLKVVHSYGFQVDKEELTKALKYDRGQYEKGYKEGYEKAIDDVLEILKRHNVPFNADANFEIMDKKAGGIDG